MTYTYDVNNNITKIVDASNTNSSKTVDYTYDDLNRLLSATATAVASGQSTYTHNYTYSAIGNILTRTDAAGTYTYAGDQGVSYANPHAVTSVGAVTYTYDNNGNMLTETSGLSNTWDYNNRLTQAVKGAVTSSYAYDHSGQRVKLANGTTTTYYPSQFYNTDGTNIIKHITIPSGETLATVKGTGAGVGVFSIHTDQLTGSNVITNTGGTQEELMDYFPFGNIRIDQRVGSFSEQRKFTGQEYDGDTGLYYYDARYYSPTVGKFVSQDPIYLLVGSSNFSSRWNKNWRDIKPDDINNNYAGGFGSEKRSEDSRALAEYLSDPQGFNSYNYVKNNPLKYADPTGEREFHFTFFQSKIGVGGEIGNSWTVGYATDGTFGISTSLKGGGLAGIDASVGISAGYSNANTWSDTLGTGQYAEVGGKVVYGGGATFNFSDGKYTGTDVGVGAGLRGLPPVPVTFSGGISKTVPVYQDSVSGIKNSLTSTVNQAVSTVKQGLQKTTSFFKKLW